MLLLPVHCNWLSLLHVNILLLVLTLGCSKWGVSKLLKLPGPCLVLQTLLRCCISCWPLQV